MRRTYLYRTCIYLDGMHAGADLNGSWCSTSQVIFFLSSIYEDNELNNKLKINPSVTSGVLVEKKKKSHAETMEPSSKKEKG